MQYVGGMKLLISYAFRARVSYKMSCVCVYIYI